MEEKKGDEINLENMSLKQKVDLLVKAAKLEEWARKEKKKEKHFKFLPKLSCGKLKKNYCIILFMRTNGYLDIMRLPIEDGFVYIKEVDMRYAVTTNSILRWKNYPVLIIQEWSLEPVSPAMLQRKTLDEKMSAFPQKILIDALKKGQTTQKKINSSILLWIIIGIIVILILLTSIFKVKLF